MYYEFIFFGGFIIPGIAMIIVNLVGNEIKRLIDEVIIVLFSPHYPQRDRKIIGGIFY